MKSLVIAIALLATVARGDHGDQYFSWNDCGGTVIKFNQIEVSPRPMVISKTHDILLSGDVNILQDLPSDAVLDLVLNKTLEINGNKYPITLPCIDGMGSCQLKMCEIWHLWYKDVVCPFFTKNGRQCDCPVTKGTFKANNIKVELPIDKFKGLIAQFASGQYHARFQITDSSKTTKLACLDLAMQLTIDKNDH